MPALQMRDAAFSDGRDELLHPVNIIVERAQRGELQCESARAAGIAARLAAGVMRCTAGEVFVADFDPKIQPVQVKRIAGLVPHSPPRSPFKAKDYFRYRAALWDLEPLEALARGVAILRTLDGLPCEEALALSGALLHRPALLILDRPTHALRDAAQAILEEAALFVTYGPGDVAAPRATAAAAAPVSVP